DGIRDDLVTGVQTCALPIYKLLHPGGPEADAGTDAAVQDARPGSAAVAIPVGVGLVEEVEDDAVVVPEVAGEAAPEGRGMVLIGDRKSVVGNGLSGRGKMQVQDRGDP